MSIVTVQLGQCGNQIGFEVFDALLRDSHSSQGLCSKRENEAYQTSCKERFFSEEENGVPIARAVLVDMEPKVINQTLSKAAQSGQWKYGQHACFCQKQGSGNNWAYGPRWADHLRPGIRDQPGQCGETLSLLNIQKLVIVQNYNSILTLSHLYRSSDALLVHENDAVHKICAKLMNIKQISFSDINQVLAHQLGSVFQPTYSAESSFHYRQNPLGDLMEHLVPHPEFKMLSVRNIPHMSENSLAYSTFTWAGLLKHLRQMLISNAKMEEGKENSGWAGWLTPKTCLLFKSYSFAGPFLFCNFWGFFCLFSTRAYIHQYTKFGIEEEDFLDGFTLLEQVIASYCNL
uniref:Tubulin delta 1 n=1 Tax=Saimiri boliviensis boliviensis TaxID=39432 RepID=A0A2K6SI45_SAIBB